MINREEMRVGEYKLGFKGRNWCVILTYFKPTELLEREFDKVKTGFYSVKQT